MNCIMYTNGVIIKVNIEIIFTIGGTAMLTNIGIPGLVLILVIALIIFGPKKLPELGKAVGQTLREFKSSTRELTKDVVEEFEDEKPKAKTKN